MPNQTQYLNDPAPPTATPADRSRLAELLATQYLPRLRAIAAKNGAPDHQDDVVADALLILLERYPGVPAEEDALRWTTVVVKRLAYAQYHSIVREPSLDALLEGTPDPLAYFSEVESAATVCERRELHRLRREALDGLKDHERLALVLKAAGLSYSEIQRRTGWTYTKVDRCLKEGRAALRSISR